MDYKLTFAGAVGNNFENAKARWRGLVEAANIKEDRGRIVEHRSNRTYETGFLSAMMPDEMGSFLVRHFERSAALFKGGMIGNGQGLYPTEDYNHTYVVVLKAAKDM